ncbi:conserved hypothetical protein [Hyphomicrobiales bacterium]|nr:conserved hypothetical protein [Hyphomicrobiales bacterium]CAH1702118.1 conserved hypothetical protein [Hyphomicrobiales bacterium]CAI0344172.1 conserved hypothetical protein [Hyphomicrobiales bacterium]
MATIKGFKAWLDTMPGSDKALTVIGSVEVPTSGWTGSLAEAVPPGINPAILILDATLTKPTGIVLQVISTVELTFRKAHSPRYDSITIRGLGSDIHVPVEIVS